MANPNRVFRCASTSNRPAIQSAQIVFLLHIPSFYQLHTRPHYDYETPRMSPSVIVAIAIVATPQTMLRSQRIPEA